MLEVTWNKDDCLALAVSTGIDSMVLLHMLNTTYKHTYKRLICLHVNHGLRDESKDEATFIQSYCDEQGIPLYVKALDLSAFVDQNKSIQDASRHLRYAWFDEMMHATHSNVLITAHHLDDLKETITYRLYTGRIGRASMGIEAVQDRDGYMLVRPLLDMSKSAIKQYQREHEVPYFEDESNQSSKYARNYVRNQLLPSIEKRQEFSTQHLIELNQWMNDARDLVKEQAVLFMERVFQTDNQVIIDRQAFNKLNRLVKVEILDQLTEQHVKRQFSMKAYREWIHVFEIFDKQSVFSISDDWQFIVAYDKLLLCEDIEFNVNSTFINRDEQYIFGNWLIETKDIASPLFVRTRLSGDRIQYYNRGNKHHKKVNRIMIDNKMNIHERDHCPILLSENEIVAVGDIWIDFYFKNTLTITYIGDDI